MFSPDSMEITSLSVYDCLLKEFIVDFSYDEVFSYTVANYKDSMIFTSQHFVPMGDSWEMTNIPFEESTIRVVNDKVSISNEQIVFKYPELTQNQIDSINKICDKLTSNNKVAKSMYPLDYETIYILFIGALKEIGDSRLIFENLKENFEFDGAAAETLEEIHYETLIRNKN